MRALYTILALFLAVTALSQEQKFQFGKPGKEDLAMMSYEKDTAAPAVMLYDNMELFYNINQRGEIHQYYTVTRRIKVLKKEGTSYGDVEFTLYSPGETTSNIEKIDAFSINVENGKTIKSELKKQFIFKEEVSESRTLVKFTIPDVKAGSLVEYRYTVRNNHILAIPQHEFQHEIPTVFSKAEYFIPEYFMFNISADGYHHIDIQRKSESKTTNIAGSLLTYTENIVTGTAADLPAMGNEPYVWNHKEYMSRLSIEIDEYLFPGSMLERISSDWESLYNTLKNSKFGAHLKMGNPLKKEMAALYPSNATEEEKIRKILSLLGSRIKWNKTLALSSDSPRGALDKGEGNSADINFILNAMLSDAGFSTTPMLLNPRYLYRLRNRATLDNINYFVLQVKLQDGSVCYLDGTNEYSDINILPEYLLVDKAHLYGDFTNKFHDLTNLTRNSTRQTIMGELGADGTLQMQVRTQYNNMDAYMKNNELAEYATEKEYAEALEKKLQTTVSELKMERENTKITESYRIGLTPVSTGEFIYLNAIMFPEYKSNPFKSSERKLPIEFNHPQTSRIDCVIKVPQGYTIEEMPKSTAVQACNGDMNIRFIANANNGAIQISYTVTINRIIYAPEEYPDISTFFAKIMELSGQQIVLKKQAAGQ